MEDNSIQMKKDLSKFLYNLRIEAVIEVIENAASQEDTASQEAVTNQEDAATQEDAANQDGASMSGPVPDLLWLNIITTPVHSLK